MAGEYTSSSKNLAKENMLSHENTKVRSVV